MLDVFTFKATRETIKDIVDFISNMPGYETLNVTFRDGERFTDA